MVTLRPAFTASFRQQLIKSIIDTEPARPRKLDPQIPRDLETIVLKAIAKRPIGSIRQCRRDGERTGQVCRAPTDPVAPGFGARATLAVVSAEPGGGDAHTARDALDDRSGDHVDDGRLEVSRSA